MKQLNQILLVDDDKANNFLNRELLAELHIARTIHVLTNGKLALDYLLENCLEGKESCPELVIFDHIMPVMDGVELIETLHQRGFMQQSNSVFILLGISSSKQEIERFKSLGVQEYTTKPLSKQTVMQAYHKYWGAIPLSSMPK